MNNITRLPKDFATRLMGVACTEDAIAHTEMISAHSLERMHGRVKYRSGESGPRNSGLTAKWRLGKHVPCQSSLLRLANQCPSIAPIGHNALWIVLRHGLHTQHDIDQSLLYLDDAAFSTVYGKLPWDRLEPITPLVIHSGKATRIGLVMQGSFDAVAALYAISRKYELENEPEKAIVIASHIPPTLALFKRSAATQRLAYLIFARLRQLSLDSLRFAGKSLRLSSYDLDEALSTAPDSLPIPNPKNPYKRPSILKHPTPIPGDLVDWILSHCAEIVKQRRQESAPRWKIGLGPAAHCARMEQVGQAFHETAIAQFRTTLGRYWSD
ncbi:MAG: hypothetical protein ACREO1_10680 [Arenimonas sp.]